MATERIYSIKTVDVSGTIPSGSINGNIDIQIDRSRIIGLTLIYNDAVYYDPIDVSLRENLQTITLIVASRTPVSQDRTYKVRISYI